MKAINALNTANANPFCNVLLASRIASYVHTGVELSSLLDTNTTCRDAIKNYSDETFTTRINRKDYYRDCQYGSSIVALVCLMRGKGDLNWGEIFSELYALDRVQEINYLIEAGAPVDSIIRSTGQDFTLLVMTAIHGKNRMFNMLLARNAHINSFLCGMNVLEHAISHKNEYIARKLILLKASVGKAYELSFQHKLINITKLLIDVYGTETNCAFNIAVRNKNLEIIQYLESKGFNIIESNCLEEALYIRDINIIKYLLQKKVWFKSKESATWLSNLIYSYKGEREANTKVTQGQEMELIELIFQEAAKRNIDKSLLINRNSKESLMDKAIKQDSFMIVPLYKCGEEITQSSFRMAIQCKNQESFELLLKLKAPYIPADILLAVIDENCVGAIPVLKRYGFKFNQARKDGVIPLNYKIHSMTIRMLETLLADCCDPNYTENDIELPMVNYVNRSLSPGNRFNPMIIYTFLNNGADPNLKIGNKYSPFETALNQDSTIIVKSFLEGKFSKPVDISKVRMDVVNSHILVNPWILQCVLNYIGKAELDNVKIEGMTLLEMADKFSAKSASNTIRVFKGEL